MKHEHIIQNRKAKTEGQYSINAYNVRSDKFQDDPDFLKITGIIISKQVIYVCLVTKNIYFTELMVG